jgi:hypothetical protein
MVLWIGLGMKAQVSLCYLHLTKAPSSKRKMITAACWIPQALVLVLHPFL